LRRTDASDLTAYFTFGAIVHGPYFIDKSSLTISAIIAMQKVKSPISQVTADFELKIRRL